MGYIRKTSKERPTGNCASCGKSFVIPSGGNLKKKFCDVKCSGKMHEKRHGADTKIPCLRCHASLLMTGAQSGRLLNWPKQRVSEIRKRFGLRTLSNSEARYLAIKSERERVAWSWWGQTRHESNINATAWMSEYNPKFPDWSVLSGIKKLDVWLYKYIVDKHSLLKLRERAKERNKESNKASNKKRKIIDPGFRVQCNLRNRLKKIMGNVKKGGTEHRNNLTGCTTKQLALHLESQFKRWMTWDNYGKKWHVDHILPCASFDHIDPKQVAQCWHWTNLRALDAITNMKKSDTITEPQMNLLLCSSH